MNKFSARETAWLQELDGIELAGFRRRAFAFCIDWAFISLILTITFALAGAAYVGVSTLLGHPTHTVNLASDSGHITFAPGATPDTDPNHTKKGIHYQLGFPAQPEPSKPRTIPQYLAYELPRLFGELIIPVLYFGLFLWRWNGQTPGKRLLKIRVVSLVHKRMTFWHSIERALGYGAAALEAGFGFFQFWIHPYRRCAQDRLAETIVVTERSYIKHLHERSTLARTALDQFR